MKVSAKSIEIVMNIISFNAYEFFANDISFQNLKQKYVDLFTRCFDSAKKLFCLNDELLRALSKKVPRDGVIQIVELLKKGADPDAVDPSGDRPIHLAIKHSPLNFQLVSKIISFGADVNVVDKYGCTPLTWALDQKYTKTIKILVEAGIDLNFQCQNGWTALMITAMNNNLQNTRILLEHGAKVNIYDTEKRTALWFAVQGKFHSVIRELLKYGANPAMCDNADNTVLCTHLREDHPKLYVINELLLHCASFKDLENGKQESFLKIMKICLEKEQYEKSIFRACVKNVIKIQMLLTNDYNTVSEFNDWYNFAISCCTEIRYMDSFKVCSCRTVANLLTRSLEGDMPLESELEALLPLVANNCFPNYGDILKAHLRKPFIRGKFRNLVISVKKEGKKDVILDFELTSKIQSYLSDEEEKNFVLAAYVKNFCERNRHSSLYPKGKNYRWNDAMEHMTDGFHRFSCI